MYLEWLVESGLTGLAAFMAMVVLWLKQGVGHFRQLRNDPLFIGLLITLCIRLWPLASTTSFFTAWSAVPFWMMVGWWLAVCRNNAAKEAS
jgi:O-antigen ligase